LACIDQVSLGETIYELVPEIAPLFDNTKEYAIGDCVIKDAALYRFTSAHAAGAWVGTDAEVITVGKELTGLKEDLSYIESLKYTTFVDIPENSNLDEYTTIGTYRSKTSAISQTLSGCPTQKAFKLVVGNIVSNSSTIQLLYENSSKIYYRLKTNINSNFTSWVSFVHSGIQEITDNNIASINDKLEEMSSPYLNYYDGDDITFTTKYTHTFLTPLPAGSYTLSAVVTSDDTVADVCRFFVNDISGQAKSIARNTRAYSAFSSNEPIRNITFMAATNTSVSTGKTATWADIMIEEGDNRSAYQPYSTTAVDLYARQKARSNEHVFVSATGDDDTGTGSLENPFATINRALQSGVSKIFVAGGKYRQTIDCSFLKTNELKICRLTPTSIVEFIAPNALIATSETKVEGYSKVYSVPCDKVFNDNNIFIFQDGINDANTLINASERHPLQGGYEYRCHDTVIERINASITLTDALDTIDTSDAYLWYHDTANSVLYYSRPNPVSENNPLCGSFNIGIFSNLGNDKTIEIDGINVKYMCMNLNSVHKAVVRNCKVSNVYGAGCYTYNLCQNAVFENCEAARAFTGTNGDGFNAHGAITGDVWAKQTHGMLLNCWSHDNRDDGFSDHERCESLIIGGLYEYNRYGGGIVPSTGSHTECYNVYARKNGEAGFAYMNDTSSEEGGVGGQMICHDCVAESNIIWEGHTQAGFKVTSNNNIGIFINCKSIGQDNAYYVNNATSSAVLIDCGSKDCITLKGGSGNFIVKNTALVE
jgi:hypothetical protein